MTKRTHAAVHPQHDDHCVRFDEKLWANWPPDTTTGEKQLAFIRARPEFGLGEVTSEVAEDKYVIACSDSIENLYWSNELGWTALTECTLFTRADIKEYGETPVANGFWMPAERAEELES